MVESRNLRIVVVGAGRVGLCLASMLVQTGDYDVRVADCTEEALVAANKRGLAAMHADASRSGDLHKLLTGAEMLIAATPERLIPVLARAAAGAGIHYLDFSEVAPETRSARQSMPSEPAFLAGSGVSPGLVDAIALDLASQLDEGCDLDIRVGAIPAKPTNRLGYSLIWNVEGLIAEYTNPSAAIVNGAAVKLPALSGHVDFEMAGTSYEAFLTSCSTNALQALVASRVRNLTFRTIRHPGHLDYMQFLLHDLDLKSRLYLLETILRNGLPSHEPDALVMRVHASGTRNGKSAEELFEWRFEPPSTFAKDSALALASSAHAATLIDALAAGKLTGEKLHNPALSSHQPVLGSRYFARLSGSGDHRHLTEMEATA